MATQLTDNLELDRISGAIEFVGLKFYVSAIKSHSFTYWLITSSAFKKMAEIAGFSSVEEVSKFLIPTEQDHPKKVLDGHHIVRTSVLHCKV